MRNSLGMRFIPVPEGSFMMGSMAHEKGWLVWHEKPKRKVTLTKAFYLGETEVTQGQWYDLMGSRPWAGMEKVKSGDDYPVTYVSWHDAEAFCKKLSQKEGISYRLPTEAEWEYACRSSTSTRFSYGDDLEYRRLKDYAWFDVNTTNANEPYPHRVAQKKANLWGLFDMHGNVYEWCQDWFEGNRERTALDPKGPVDGTYKIFRGGYWGGKGAMCRSGLRIWDAANERHEGIGFRVVCTRG